MDARLFDGAFAAGDPHALWAAAPPGVRAHSLGRDRDGDRLARGDRRRRAVGRAGGRRDPRSLLKEHSGNLGRFGSRRHNARTFADPYVRRSVILAPGCSDPLYRKAIRVSMGGTLVVPFARGAPWPEALACLGERGFTVVALTPDGGTDIGEFGTSRPVAERVALLLGA